jgi:hypothetical protein
LARRAGVRAETRAHHARLRHRPQTRGRHQCGRTRACGNPGVVTQGVRLCR